MKKSKKIKSTVYLIIRENCIKERFAIAEIKMPHTELGEMKFKLNQGDVNFKYHILDKEYAKVNKIDYLHPLTEL